MERLTKEQIESLEHELEGISLLIGALNEYTSVLTESEYKRIEPRAWKRRDKIDKILQQHRDK
jgi:Asp-tRNA(Asn)/Glu-tRNA(Gln) amidotransferase C subunit